MAKFKQSEEAWKFYHDAIGALFAETAGRVFEGGRVVIWVNSNQQETYDVIQAVAKQRKGLVFLSRRYN